MRSGLGWQSLNPVEAVAAVHSVENKDLLLRIAYEARNPEARRLALIKMGDKGLMASFAQSDSSPIVRRRMAGRRMSRAVIRGKRKSLPMTAMDMNMLTWGFL